MRTAVFKTLLPALLIALLVPFSCAKIDTPPEPAAPGPQPGTVPSAPPSASPSPTPTGPAFSTVTPRIFQQAYERKWCPYPECPAVNGFRVDYLGNYTVGPEHQETLSGRILENERVTLNALGNAVADEYVDGPTVCETIQGPPLVGMSSVLLRVLLSDGYVRDLYRVDAQQGTFCYAGDPAIARALYDFTDRLARTYATP